jgi:small conductance mechanosensitive channel
VAYRENTDEVIKVIKQIDENLRSDEKFKGDILMPLEVLGLDRFADSAIIIRARYATKPARQWDIGREFNRRLKLAFDKEGIEIPYPHMTVYMGESKQGEAPTLNVRLTRQ